MTRPAFRLRILFLILVLACAARTGFAQSNLVIYSDKLENGFQDYSWGVRSFTNTSPVNSGSNSISVSSQDWEALSFYHPNFDTTIYSNINFWINGGAGGQILQVQGILGNTAQPAVTMSALPANTWQHITISLASLGVANKTNFNRVWFQLTASGTTNTYYVDDVQLGAKPPPAVVHITVNTTQTIRTVDARHFGINTAIWDGNLDTPTTASLLREMGFLTLRFPGGSLSDQYHWASNTSSNNTWTWVSSFSNFAHLATNIGALTFITVNYGTGTPAEAAAWVKNSNITNHYGFKYWEVGNECYGGWETDSNTVSPNNPHDAYTYATRAQQYIQQMKAADPTIKVGVVVTPGETNNSNSYTNHPAYNPRTGQTNYGWTAVLLTTLKNLGVTPDFLVHHRYPEFTDGESDPFLLQGTGGWAADAADLRQQITDYFGPGGTNIELVCTENNSNAGAQGKQSTSLVNALYLADSLAELMKTELNAFCWWDLRNSRDSTGNMDPILYGWRPYGDIGTLDGLGDVLTNRYPHFYTGKLMQYFVRGGDTILNSTSDYQLISAHAARRADGSVSLLVINKDGLANYNVQIAVNGFTPSAAATIHSYGIPQDNAARFGTGSPDIALTNLIGASTNFNYTFAPYSATMLTLIPIAPSMTILSQSASGKFVFQLNGQPGTPYVLQTSTNFVNWTPVATNILASTSLLITNTAPASSSSQFWRAVWVP